MQATRIRRQGFAHRRTLRNFSLRQVGESKILQSHNRQVFQLQNTFVFLCQFLFVPSPGMPCCLPRKRHRQSCAHSFCVNCSGSGSKGSSPARQKPRHNMSPGFGMRIHRNLLRWFSVSPATCFLWSILYVDFRKRRRNAQTVQATDSRRETL